jgi:hypothetical protein
MQLYLVHSFGPKLLKPTAIYGIIKTRREPIVNIEKQTDFAELGEELQME